jgi:NAD(P)-dependent dehydrogenase (short-subunit alcohol dehydrogenase family)
MPTAIVTGASRGLGRALAVSLAADGWDVVVDARHGDALAAAGLPATVTAIPGDVTDPAHRRDLVAAAAATGRLDLLVNNASALGPSPLPRLADLSLDALAGVLGTNVIAPLGLVQAALPLLGAASGVIVDVTSDAAVEPYEGWGGYGASKAALDQLTAVLGAEHPELRVYAVDPGDLRTQMHQDAFPGEDISDRPEPETVVPAVRRLLAARPPSGRYRAADWARPGDAGPAPVGEAVR